MMSELTALGEVSDDPAHLGLFDGSAAFGLSRELVEHAKHGFDLGVLALQVLERVQRAGRVTLRLGARKRYPWQLREVRSDQRRVNRRQRGQRASMAAGSSSFALWASANALLLAIVTAALTRPERGKWRSSASTRRRQWTTLRGDDASTDTNAINVDSSV